MKHLVLFLTQGEAGAPGYLSSLGDDGALSLAEHLKNFTASLGLDLDTGCAERAQALEALRASGHVDRPTQSTPTAPSTARGAPPQSFEEGLATALRLCPQLLICSGTSVRSRKTLAPLVEHLALPVVLLDGLDAVEAGDDEPLPLPGRQISRSRNGNDLASGLARLFGGPGSVEPQTLVKGPGHNASRPALPSLIVVQTSLAALCQWLPKAGMSAAPENIQAMIAALENVSEADRIPALAALGFEAGAQGPWPGRWLLDETVEPT